MQKVLSLKNVTKVEKFHFTCAHFLRELTWSIVMSAVHYLSLYGILPRPPKALNIQILLDSPQKGLIQT